MIGIEATSKEFYVMLGETKLVSFYVKNTGKRTLHNIRFKDPDIIPIKIPKTLKPNEKRLFKVNVKPSKNRITPIIFVMQCIIRDATPI